MIEPTCHLIRAGMDRSDPTAASEVEPIDAHAEAGLPLLAGGASANVAIGDLDDLFHAVKARLRHTVGDGFSKHCQARGDDTAARIRANVLECVSALDQLHTTLRFEAERRRLLEQKLQDAFCVLAEVRPEPLRSAASLVPTNQNLRAG